MTLEVQDNTARLLRELIDQARMTPLPVDQYLELLVRVGPSIARQETMSPSAASARELPGKKVTPEEFDRLMAEADAIDAASPNRPIHDPPLTYSREDIYFDHD